VKTVLLALILELLSLGRLRILGTFSVDGVLSIYSGVKTDCAMQAWYLMSGEHTGKYLLRVKAMLEAGVICGTYESRTRGSR
jgi:hypothetical protein